MTPEERATELVFPGGEHPSMISFRDPTLFGPKDLADMIAAAIRAAETDAVVQNKRVMSQLCEQAIREAERAAEQRGAEREREACAVLLEDHFCDEEMAAAIRARGKEQEAETA